MGIIHSRIILLILCFAASVLHAETLNIKLLPEDRKSPLTSWQGNWIWISKNDTSKQCCFRKTFFVSKKVKHAFVQVAGDDIGSVYLNGQECLKFEGWLEYTSEVTDKIKSGENVLGVDVKNVFGPGGLLLELTVIYADCSSDIIKTDKDWKLSKSRPNKAWLTTEYNDSTWQRAKEVCHPPAPPWGYVVSKKQQPILKAGAVLSYKIISNKPPTSKESGELVISVLAPAKTNVGFGLTWKSGNEIFSRRLFQMSPSPKAWKKGETIRIQIPPQPILNYLPNGSYSLKYGPLDRPSISEKDNLGLTRSFNIKNRQHKSRTPESKIANWKGKPALFVNNQPLPPIWFGQFRLNAEDVDRFKKAGVRLFSFTMNDYYGNFGWKGPNAYNFEKFDKLMLRFLSVEGNMYCMPRIWVGAPKWWLESHPDQKVKYARNVKEDKNIFNFSGSKHESMASMQWRRDMGKALTELVKHISNSAYANRVIGIHLMGGIYGEWHYWQPNWLPDTSEPMRQAFRKYLIKKYDSNQDLLRKAWNDNDVTFETISIPTETARNKTDEGFFRDPAKSRKVADYYECYHQTVAEAIDYFCKIVKQASGGKLLTSVFYGYHPDQNWSQEGDTLGLYTLLESRSLDMFSAPYSYRRRHIGGDEYMRVFNGSIAANNKLYIAEADGNTSPAVGNSFCFEDARGGDINATEQVFKREFGNAVTNGIGMWYLDFHSNWFANNRCMALMKSLINWGQISMKLSRKSVAEVAIITSTDSAFYQASAASSKNNITDYSYVQQVGELCNAGAPFEMYLIEDLCNGKVPEHKVYLFLDCNYLSNDQRRSIEKLKSNNKTLIWLYAPGYASQKGLSLSKMESLTGMKFFKDSVPEFKIKAKDRATSSVFGPGGKQEPVFVPDRSHMRVLGHFANTSKPALVIKKFPKWRSVYSAVPGIPSGILRDIYRTAGVHVYSQSDEPFQANASWIMLHTNKPGRKTIRLPHNKDVFDVFANKLVGQNIKMFTVDLPTGTTGLYMLANPVDVNTKAD